MNEHTRELVVAGGKIAAGAGPIGFGIWTLNDVAILVGIFTSLIVAAHTAWKFYCDVRDRRRRGDQA